MQNNEGHKNSFPSLYSICSILGKAWIKRPTSNIHTVASLQLYILILNGRNFCFKVWTSNQLSKKN